MTRDHAADTPTPDSGRWSSREVRQRAGEARWPGHGRREIDAGGVHWPSDRTVRHILQTLAAAGLVEPADRPDAYHSRA